MARAAIPAFPYEQAPFLYPGDALRKEWKRLHRGDREPCADSPKLCDAWRAFHRGDFAEAIALGARAGPAGAVPACKAAGVAATYLVEDDRAAVALLREAAARALRAAQALPRHANAWYVLAFVLGRYAQRVSVVKALAEGVGGRVRDALDRSIELEPAHADAHVALGLYHAEIIDKVGSLAGRLTYGADARAAVRHFEQALELNPGSAIAHMEYANGLLMIEGDRGKKKAIGLYRKAAACKPADAMERLDVEQAKAELG